MRQYVAAALVLMAMCAAVHAQEQNPVAYQPGVVGAERIFLVALNVPTAVPEIAITVPDEVELLDRTPLPTDNELRKYYFRTISPSPGTDIVFAHPDGPISVSVEIWSYEDLREFRDLGGIQLPRRWPLGERLPELKQGRTIITSEHEQAAKDEPGRHWLELTAEQIWSLQPDSTIPRWHWVNLKLGCPVHGREIYRDNMPFYPWLDENDDLIRHYRFGENASASVPHAWKIKCPVGGELYPSNDFGNFDFTGGEFPDDGIGGGYIAPDGTHYLFIAEIAQSYAHNMLNVAPECAQSYLATGDIEYAHRALVALSRLAVEYSYLATMLHHRHRNDIEVVRRLGHGRFGEVRSASGFTVYCVDQPPYQRWHAEAYDMIWPAIEEDDRIIPFLQSKGFTHIETHEDLRRFIEEDLFAVWMQGAMDGATHANPPKPQWGMMRMAECLNYERGYEFMDWVYFDRRGKMRYFPINNFFRDGAPYESTGPYNAGHVDGTAGVVDSIERIRAMRPDRYPEARYPNFTATRSYRSIFDFCMNTVNIDRVFPRVGDVGWGPEYSPAPVMTWNSADARAMEHAYEIFQHPKFAWALANAPDWSPSPDFAYTQTQVEAAAERWPDDWNDASRLQDGYGLAMLRSGEGINKRALWMTYGRPRRHVHDDMFHMGLDAYQSEILGHMGYPRNWSYWEGHWMTHNQARQVPFVDMTAQAQLFADAGVAHVGETLAHGFTDRVAEGEGYVVDENNWKRRMLALIDVSEEDYYALDLYRIFGGGEHWWTFHCQDGEFSTEGLNLVEQPGGTLAGPDVPYGDGEWLQRHGLPFWAFAHLYNVARDSTPQNVWSAEWKIRDSDDLHFRMTVPAVEDAEVVICDGKHPEDAATYEMKWVLMNRTGETPVRTQVANIMEMYRGEPVIRSVEALKVSGDDESGFDARGLVVELNNGRVDTIFAAADPTIVRTAPGGFEFAGRFGLLSEQDGKITNISLLGGTRLVRNGLGVTLDSAQYRGTIVATDREACSITVSPAPPKPEALVGRYIFIVNEHRRLAQEVVGIDMDGEEVVLHLEFDPLVGIGQVTGHEAGLIRTSTPFRVRGMRYYHGARVGNRAGDPEYRIAGIDGGVFIDTAVHPGVGAETLAEQFPAGTWFNVYDYGVGDDVILPHTVSVSLDAPMVYQVTATDEVTVSLPEGATAVAAE